MQLLSNGIGSVFGRIAVILLCLFFWGPVRADVTIAGLTQSPDPVISGQIPIYTLTVDNLARVDEFVSIAISIDGVENSIQFTSVSADCGLDGIYYCSTPIPGGGSATYQFTWDSASAPGNFSINFDVQCSSANCIGDNRTILTSVIAESVSVTSLDLSGGAGDTVSASFTVINSLPATITTAYPGSSVTPANLPAGENSVQYNLTIPSSAIANEVISDTITITDSEGAQTTIPVTVTVVGESVTITEIVLSAVPGGSATETFTVSNALSTSIATDPAVDSTVDPTSLPAGGGDVVYSITVPADAVFNEVITDTVTVTDSAGNQSTIPVTLTVTGDSVTITEIVLSAVPGGSASETFTVTNALSTTITTDPAVNSTVDPTSLPTGGGDVVYSITVPSDAVFNEVISDIVTITDSAGNQSTIPVTLTVAGDSVTITEIVLTAAPGGTATETFTVTNALSTTIATDPSVDSTVDPITLPVGGGSVTYSITIPLSAADNEVITDTITITDSAQHVATIDVSITAAADLFADLPGLTESEREVAHALDEACAALSGSEIVLPPDEFAARTPTDNLLEICNALDSASIQDQVDAIRQITPKQAPAQGTTSVEVSRRQFDNITARMNALRSGHTGISISGLNIDYEGKALPINLLASSARHSGGSAGEENTALFGRLGFFINGNLSFGEKDGSSNELGFDIDTQGVTAGLDYRFTDQFIVGGSVGYVGSDTQFDSSRGDMDVQGYTLAIYSTYYWNAASYLDGIISYGWNDFDSSRKVSFLGFNEEASGDTDGTEISISLGGGYDFNFDALSLGPTGRVNYVNADIDGYSETSSTGLELIYQDQEVESLTTLIGGQLSYAISTSRGVFSPQLRLEWAHEYMNDSRYIKAHFKYDPTNTSFRLATDDPDRDYFNLGAGVSATFGTGKSGYLYYETVLDQRNVRQYTLAAGFRLEF